jgi:hypothetical protein
MQDVERTFGASFRRDLDCWIVYEGAGETELCRCSWDKVDDVLSLLRAISAMHQTTQCAGCEGKPAPENSPCAVCGMAMPNSFDRGWNAAIDELERQDGFGEWADAAKFMRQLKKDTGHE